MFYNLEIKFTLGLIAVSVIISLGQAYPSTDFDDNSPAGVDKDTLLKELMDFVNLLPMDEVIEIIAKYVTEDIKVREALDFIETSEFDDLMRTLESLNEYQVYVEFLKKVGLPIEESVKQKIQHALSIKDNPSKIESKVQVGDGMEGMFKYLLNVLPLDKIDALYEEKMKTSKVYGDFITKIMSKELDKIVNDLIANDTYKMFITKTKEKGLEFEALALFDARMIGIKSEYDRYLHLNAM
ncbi:uncharacterized protein LOC105830611 [Monomorium pharaonis]|uniref:uncharacterized protein LOC105830611 n=1 Tax=Monomorium pharaonis TaxID=307658 RepID=UPI00063F58DB|nr:uncharacterized protein LOC105830611 [Monomorium pharaonis]